MIHNLKPEPIMVDVYVLVQCFYDGKVTVWTSTYKREELALKAAIATVHEGLRDVEETEDTRALADIINDPDRHDEFLEAYGKYMRGEQWFDIQACSLEL